MLFRPNAVKILIARIMAIAQWMDPAVVTLATKVTDAQLRLISVVAVAMVSAMSRTKVAYATMATQESGAKPEHAHQIR